MWLTLLFTGCCSLFAEPATTRLEDFGGGVGSLTITDADGITAESATIGVTADEWEGSFADGQSGVMTSDTFTDAEGPSTEFSGILYVQVCALADAGDCGSTTLCFVSGWISGEMLDREEQLQSAALQVAGADGFLGTTAGAADATVQVGDVTHGEASFMEPMWRDGADACLESFRPASVAVAWQFDDRPIRSRDIAGPFCE